MLVAGIDAGSNTIKVVLMEGNQILSHRIAKAGANSLAVVNDSIKKALKDHKKKMEELVSIVSTGYGRDNIPFSTFQATEIFCHAVGVIRSMPQVRTVIDIGGQDSKVIYLDNSGQVVDFVMNDKCAAGTGRFIEMLALVLETPLEEMGRLSIKAKNEITISNTCTVFAESEVISYLAKGFPKEEIISGVHHAIVTRILAMTRRREIRGEVCLTGGVAKNIGVVRWMGKELGQSLCIPEEPQLTGAIGAALIALEKTSRKGGRDVQLKQ
jgi:(R)-2-hydroxyacyl-CoA dehydratese activating ATPase